MAEDEPVKKQAKIIRFFKSVAKLTPEDLEFATVQAVKSRHVAVKSHGYATEASSSMKREREAGEEIPRSAHRHG